MYLGFWVVEIKLNGGRGTTHWFFIQIVVVRFSTCPYGKYVIYISEI